jgi:L-ascorbate metabolism protein UlaG (beta-lactamase superfamily)
VKITHFGHACLLVETASARLLFDPGTESHGWETLTGLDAVLITHAHADHFDAEKLPALFAANRGAILIADSETAAAIPELTPRVAQEGDTFELRDSIVTVWGGAHANIYLDFPGSGNVAYSVDNDSFFHPGDSFTLPTGAVDVLALPISGPWLKLGESAAYMVSVGPRIAVPMHEAQLANTAGAHAMLGMFAPAGTAVQPLERGVATEV